MGSKGISKKALQQRGEEADDAFPEFVVPGAAGPGGGGDFGGQFQILEEDGLVQAGGPLVEQKGVDLVVDRETAVVHVGGADLGEVVVADEGFGVDEIAAAFVDADPGGQAFREIGLVGGRHVGGVGFPGQHQPDIDTAEGGCFQSHQDRFRRDEVGGLEVEIILGVVRRPDVAHLGDGPFGVGFVGDDLHQGAVDDGERSGEVDGGKVGTGAGGVRQGRFGR